MVEYCLDTNVLIEMLRNNKIVIAKLNKLTEQGIIFFITYITICELYKGANLHSKREEKLREVENLISSLNILEFDISSCSIFGETYKYLSDKGNLIPESDLMIASIVKANDLILITKDKNHFIDTGVKLEIW